MSVLSPRPPAATKSLEKALAPQTPNRDRTSYLWLGLGLLLLSVGTVRWTIPLAAWLYPVFMLRFVRKQGLLPGVAQLFGAVMLLLAIELQGFFPLSGTLNYLAPVGLAVIFGTLVTIPYLIDRALSPRLGGVFGSLVFPLALTSVWYLSALVNPFGSFGNPAYTQYGDLPLLQMLSVTGLWGIDLLMGWFASLINLAWERGIASTEVRPSLLFFIALVALILVGGEARLAFFAPQGPTVRIAGVTASRTSPLPSDSFDDQAQAQIFFNGTATEAQRQAIRPLFQLIDDDLLSQTRQEANAGAKFVVWPEMGAVIFQEDEDAFLQQARNVARESGIYLDMGLLMFLPQRTTPFARDLAIMIGPDGTVLSTYFKTHIIPVMETSWTVPGDGHLPLVATPYGRLATAICYDADFPGTIIQAGQADTDILLRPTGDWRAIDPLHAQMATFRAIENGFSLVDQAKDGLSIAVDYEGNVLATSDYFTNNPQETVAYVPTKGARTIYSMIGDLFAWLSLAALVALIGVLIARRNAPLV